LVFFHDLPCGRFSSSFQPFFRQFLWDGCGRMTHCAFSVHLLIRAFGSSIVGGTRLLVEEPRDWVVRPDHAAPDGAGELFAPVATTMSPLPGLDYSPALDAAASLRKAPEANEHRSRRLIFGWNGYAARC
jgi:hypothetical protein